jgi:hypothetical protein
MRPSENDVPCHVLYDMLVKEPTVSSGKVIFEISVALPSKIKATVIFQECTLLVVKVTPKSPATKRD